MCGLNEKSVKYNQSLLTLDDFYRSSYHCKQPIASNSGALTQINQFGPMWAYIPATQNQSIGGGPIRRIP